MIKRIFKDLFENIKEDKGTFFSSITSFVLIFTLINIFVFVMINTDSYRLKEEQSNQVIVYISDIKDDEKENLQSKILELNGVSSLRYIPKEVALKSLEKELNVDLSSEENPLEDAFFVYLTRDVNIDELNAKLSSMSEITEIDLRAKLIKQNVDFSISLDSFIKNSIIFLIIFSSIMIFNISMLSIKTRKREIFLYLKEGLATKYIKMTLFLESLLSITIASIISYVLYKNLKGSIVELIRKMTNSLILVDNTSQEFYVLILVFLSTILVSLLINFIFFNKYYKISYYNKELEEVKESICEINEEDKGKKIANKEDLFDSFKNEIEKLKNMIKIKDKEDEDFEEFKED